MNALVVTQGLLIYGLLAWKLSHLVRAPHDLPLRCVVGCLACAATAYPIGIAFALAPSSPAARWLMVSQCSLLIAVAYCLDCFFLFSLLAPAAATRRAARLAFALAAAVIVMAVAAGAAPVGTSMDNRSVAAVAIVYLVFDVAMGYFLADASVRALRGIREAAGPTALGLRLAVVGLAVMVAGLAALTATVVMQTVRISSPPAITSAGQFLVMFGVVAFLAGVCYPGSVTRLSAARLWNRRRRTYRQLDPLWSALHQAFPQDALVRVPVPRWREAVSPWSVHRRFYRRVIECRDGLVRLSPYLEPTGGPMDGLVADQLIAALQTIDMTSLVPRQAVPVAVPEGGGLDADADELARLSRQIAAKSSARALPALEQLPLPLRRTGGTRS